MKKVALVFLFLPLFLFAEASVWKIQKNRNIVYIGGTIHILSHSDYPLPKEYDIAYNLSQKLYFETNLSKMNSNETQQKVLKEMILPKGETLSNILSNDVYDTLESYCKKYSLNIKDFEQYKPSMVVLVLTVAQFDKIGFNMDGVDNYFEKKALKDKKDIGTLETVDEQISFVSSLAKGNENRFVMQSLKDLDKIEKLFPKIVASWKKGDIKSLNEFLIFDMKKDYPELYKTLLVQRNNNWLPLIKAMFNDKRIEFVLVGTAHLIGRDGVIEKLKKEGYKVEKVK